MRKAQVIDVTEQKQTGCGVALQNLFEPKQQEIRVLLHAEAPSINNHLGGIRQTQRSSKLTALRLRQGRPLRTHGQRNRLDVAQIRKSSLNQPFLGFASRDDCIMSGQTGDVRGEIEISPRALAVAGY